MIDIQDFKKYAHELVDWIADYYENIDKYPVKAQVSPGDIISQLPDHAPAESESMDAILKDFQSIIMPGMTHWQSPNFHAYFPANASYPSLLAEMLTASLAAQCMIWDTSPAAAELEEQVINWLKEMTGLPVNWSGVIHDGASTATLTALITAREKKSSFDINKNGFHNQRYRVYCSAEAHSSIEKAVRISGIGDNNLVKIKVDDALAMDIGHLRQSIQSDLNAGYTPLCVIAALGTTGTTAIDPLEGIAGICEDYKIWLHVDAAYAGTLLLLPEYRWMIKGIEQVDSYVFNPHKWMFTHFDCTAYFVKDKEALIRTFTILPEYLKTTSKGQVNDYRDWGIPMGRRFRALKLWFVIRNFGVNGLMEKVRHHLQLAADFETQVINHPDFEILTERTMNVVLFRYHPASIREEEKLNLLNEKIMNRIKDDGRIFITHTKVSGKLALRMVIAQTYVEEKHINKAWQVIQEISQHVNIVTKP